MESRNICKFNIHRSSDLICTNFVYETKASQSRSCVASAHQLAIVTEGRGRLLSGGQEIPLAEGDIFFLRRGEEFSVRDGGELGYIYITFRGRRADELAERICPSSGALAEHMDGCEELIKMAFRALSRAESENLDLFSEGLLLYLLAHLGGEKRVEGDLVGRMVTLTHDYFTDPGFSLSALAKELGYDAKYLSSFFKKKKGIAFTEYLRDLRIRHAIFLMEQGVVSVKNIAVLAGFGDALYFSKVFKGEMGKSPKAYMEELEAEAKFLTLK